MSVGSSGEGPPFRRSDPRTILTAAISYFGLVFGAGFALGTLRVLLVAPVVGETSAELIETPIMLVAIVLAARFVLRRFLQSTSGIARWMVGLIALASMIGAELTLVLALRGLTIQAYLESRDPVAGSVYLASLLFFAAAPALLGRHSRPRS